MFPARRDFEQMILNTGTGILIHEASSKNILWANPAACRIFGFTLEELKPLKAHHMSAQERQYRREVGVAWLQSAVVHGSSRKQWKYRAKDGTDGDAEPVEVKVELPVDAHLPHDYVPGERLRLEVYKKLAAVKDDAELADIIAEVTDRYGTPPQPVRALFEVARLRTLARRAGVEMPLTEAVHEICHEGGDAVEVAVRLMRRSTKPE